MRKVEISRVTAKLWRQQFGKKNSKKEKENRDAFSKVEYFVRRWGAPLIKKSLVN